MKVRCRTNLDDYKKEQWPEEFCCRPMIGDKVQAKSGKELYICTITHTTIKGTTDNYQSHVIIQPMLIIELTKRGIAYMVNKLELTEGRILVEYIDPKIKTKGGILIPNAAKVRPTRAVVLDIGPAKVLDCGKVIPMPVKIGDHILMSLSGSEVEGQENQKLRIITTPDVLAIVKE